MDSIEAIAPAVGDKPSVVIHCIRLLNATDGDACGVRGTKSTYILLQVSNTTIRNHVRHLHSASKLHLHYVSQLALQDSILGGHIAPIYSVILGAKTINVFRAYLGAQLTICAQK